MAGFFIHTMKKSSITLEMESGKIIAARVPVTADMMRLAKKGAKICGASVEQCIIWGLNEGLLYMRSGIEDGTLRSNAHEPHLIKVNEGTSKVRKAA